ncbi:response regulator transcription factor [Flagellimonas sp.]|uniref:response regulator transcription factor n=1 Tax=Flagellimonas sp. TaxID=2058762 RepID=UPI003BAFCAE1
MKKRNKLLLVEDDPNLGYLLSEYLEMKDFEVVWAKNGTEALTILDAYTFDLAILDVMLPDTDGFELARNLKNVVPELPFLFLTAKSLKVDVLKGFVAGAVDYLKKPIDEEELVVRIETLLSRLVQAKGSAPLHPIYNIGAYTLDTKNQELHFEKEIITLTGKEYELLIYLYQNRNQLCTHKEILTIVWDKNDYFNKKSLSVFISRLRHHLGKDSKVQIENVHRRGFVLRIEN